jgi:hypothetical protein
MACQRSECSIDVVWSKDSYPRTSGSARSSSSVDMELIWIYAVRVGASTRVKKSILSRAFDTSDVTRVDACEIADRCTCDLGREF